MLREALAQHAEILEALEGEPFTYSRASTSVSGLLGVLAQTKQDEENGSNRSLVSARLLDCLVRPAVWNTTSFSEPKPGDTLVSDNDGRRFEVHSQNQEPCWIWSDERHTFYRIHLLELKPQT